MKGRVMKLSLNILVLTLACVQSGCSYHRGLVYSGKQDAKISTEKNCVVEIQFRSTMGYSDPYNEVTLDVIFEGPNDSRLRVPAFWIGGDVWAVRFAGEQTGKYSFRSVCSDPRDAGLHGRTGTIRVRPYTGTNPLLQHGRLRVADDKRHFVHADGTDFFWLGDTWWMGLTKRLDWPKGFKQLTADRVKKGFNVIQIVAGPLPDMDTWDPRGRNEEGWPFEANFAGINARFYARADLKIKHLADSGIMPCIVGMWGYHLPKIGTEKVKRYWRYIVARYGAYPVVWCLAGESTMPYYLSKTMQQDRQFQQKAWCEVAAYVRSIDAYHNLRSVHPGTNARDMTEDPDLFDFEMLQTGHGGYDSIAPTLSLVSKAVAREPRMPVVNSEVNYEGIAGQSWQDVQRLSFYASVFSGAAGCTYGANGIWQLNEENKPYGPSPHGRTWGNMPWRQAMHLPGGRQVALGGRLIARFAWWQFEKHQEWVQCERPDTDPKATRCIGIPRRVRLVYLPTFSGAVLLKNIEPDVRYRAYYFDPLTGAERDIGFAAPDENGNWRPPSPVEFHDWLIVLKAAGN